MAFVVTEACIRCKYTDCVEVCPVDCFYEGENMLVIHPDECIDCGDCVPECPVDAIHSDTAPGRAGLGLNPGQIRHPIQQRAGASEITIKPCHESFAKLA